MASAVVSDVNVRVVRGILDPLPCIHQQPLQIITEEDALVSLTGWFAGCS